MKLHHIAIGLTCVLASTSMLDAQGVPKVAPKLPSKKMADAVGRFVPKVLQKVTKAAPKLIGPAGLILDLGIELEAATEHRTEAKVNGVGSVYQDKVYEVVTFRVNDVDVSNGVTNLIPGTNISLPG